MAGFFLVQTRDRAFCESALAGARAQFALHGFTNCVEIDLPGWTLLHAPHIIGGPDCLLAEGDDLIAIAGTLVCDGRIGRPALETALREIDWSNPDWTRIGGHFVAIVHRAGRLFLVTDFFAAFQAFHDHGRRFFSTSLLAATAALPRVSFDPQGVYEFAFNVVPVGNDTVFNELKLVGPDHAVELTGGEARLHPIAKPLPDQASASTIEEHIARHRDRLGAIVGPHVAAFGSNVYCPLSGGLDSRLLLALLRAEGCRPNIYVYGSPGSPDVRVAQEIGAAQGFAVDWIDKDTYRTIEPDAFPEQVERNFQVNDALPNFGELFESGSNAAARDARHRDGAMSASGGCGEIFRNFFFLPDRRLSAAAVAGTFFARFVRQDMTDRFDPRAFLRAIEDKILHAIGRPGDRTPLPRQLIEQVYPRIRCRTFFGREISLEARYGAYLMPFLDHQVVAEAMTLPLPLKNAGRFEAQLIHAIDPELARLPSAYGHDFAGPPSRSHRWGEFTSRIRPAWLRQRSYGVRRRLGPMADEHGGLLTPDYMGRVVDLEYPVMRRFFRTDRITDSSVMRRVANLEYFAHRLGSRLSG